MLFCKFVFQLNRASIIEESRVAAAIGSTGRLFGSGLRSGIRSLNKRTSLYLPQTTNNHQLPLFHNIQHSPSTASDELNDDHGIV